MNKRDLILSMLESNQPPPAVPAGFFIHFDPSCHRGQAAVRKHLEFFRYTGMDFVKIQYENSFPPLPEIRTPADWARMPFYRQEFYQDQLDVVAGLVAEAKKEALVIQTLYSPFMCAGSTAGKGLLKQHIEEDPEAVRAGLEVITDSLMLFVGKCIELGVDGFYASTQGGEIHRFGGSPLFAEVIKPFDLRLMEEINRTCPFNVLHVCDYHGGYDDLAPFLDYPGHVVNCSLDLGTHTLSAVQAAEMFGRPFMGGLERKGVIATGTPAEVTDAVSRTLEGAPERFILAADCTLPNEVDWLNIKTAIETAHGWQRA